MERISCFLNGRWGLGDGVVVYPIPKNNALLREAVEKLAAYENTGLKPEEVATLQQNHKKSPKSHKTQEAKDAAFAFLQKELDSWDPMDLASIAGAEEYRVESRAIANRLYDGISMEETAAVIRDVLVEHFGNLLPANNEEIENSGPVQEADGYFSQKCICLAKELYTCI